MLTSEVSQEIEVKVQKSIKSTGSINWLTLPTDPDIYAHHGLSGKVTYGISQLPQARCKYRVTEWPYFDASPGL